MGDFLRLPDETELLREQVHRVAKAFSQNALEYVLDGSREHNSARDSPWGDDRVLYCDQVARDGGGRFRLAGGSDLEDTVAKGKFEPKLPDRG